MATVTICGVFFDTNVLKYVFYPMADVQGKAVAEYTKLYKEIIKLKIPIYTDIIVIQEFVNLVLRINYDRTLNYKKFRKSETYQKMLEELSDQLNLQILKNVQICCLDHNNESVGRIIDSIKNRNLDFNDYHIMMLCKTKNFCLVTHDADYNDCYKEEKVRIMTANTKYFSK